MAEASTEQTTVETQGGPLAVAAEHLAQAQGRLSDRGVDPHQVLGQGELGDQITVAGFYAMLGMIAATEKAGQGPTHAMARLALRTGQPTEIADTLFLAYNQQSAEEASHGDKVFGNAYYSMGGYSPAVDLSAIGNGGGPGFLAPADNLKENKKRLGSIAAFLGGIETVALNRVFPLVISLCEQWNHPIGNDLLRQIHETVRAEESRHVLTWRYVFHHMIAPKGDAVVTMYLETTNAGRRNLGSPPLERDAMLRMLGTSAPTPRQLLGKDRLAFS